jgi:hypothetical protein
LSETAHQSPRIADAFPPDFICVHLRNLRFISPQTLFRSHLASGPLVFAAQIMKWFSVLFLAAVIAVFSNACEMHPASQLPPEEEVPGEAHSEAVKAEAQAAPETAPSEAAKPPAATPGEAPRYFPEKK